VTAMSVTHSVLLVPTLLSPVIKPRESAGHGVSLCYFLLSPFTSTCV